jgi:signal transduction histidine kinase
VSASGLARLAWALCVLTVVVLAAGAGIVLTHEHRTATEGGFSNFPVLPLTTAAGATVGALIVSRHPRHPVGWLFVTCYLAAAFGLLFEYHAERGLTEDFGPAAVAHVSAWLGNVVGLQVQIFLVTMLLLLFPEGRPLSRAWLPVAVLAVASLVGVAAAIGVATGPPTVAELLTGPAEGPAAWAVQTFGGLQLVVLVAAVAAFVRRLRRSSGDEHSQLRWLGAALCTALSLTVVHLVSSNFGPDLPPRLLAALVFTSYATIPLAAGVAILKFHLYDIDLVINRAIFLGGLAVFVMAGYTVVVVVLGRAVGERAGSHVGVSLAATVAVALAFQPVRRAVKRLADRVAYGPRATPYEALSEFSDRIAHGVSADQTLPRVAAAVAHGVGARASTAELDLSDGTTRSASWPRDAHPADGRTSQVAVSYRGQRVGRIEVTMPPGVSLTTTGRRLLADLAAQAGLALRNAQLMADLEQRLDLVRKQEAALRSARQRIVAAAQESRRRLRRDVRDAPDRQLAAVASGLEAIPEMLDHGDVDTATDLADDLAVRCATALEQLRDVATSVFPTTLAAKGLPDAIRAHLRSRGIDAQLRLQPRDGSARYSLPVEVAAYHFCTEALRAVRRNAAHLPTVRISATTEGLEVAVEGRSVGADGQVGGADMQSITDRVTALGGTLDTRSDGTSRTVTGRFPVRPLEPRAPGPVAARGSAPPG